MKTPLPAYRKISTNCPPLSFQNLLTPVPLCDGALVSVAAPRWYPEWISPCGTPNALGTTRLNPLPALARTGFFMTTLMSIQRWTWFQRLSNAPNVTFSIEKQLICLTTALSLLKTTTSRQAFLTFKVLGVIFDLIYYLIIQKKKITAWLVVLGWSLFGFIIHIHFILFPAR